MKQQIFTAIKPIAIAVIASALGLELWQRYAELTQTQIPNFPVPLIWLARFALISHAIEGAIAAVYAPLKQKKPLPYGLYTFFVGTIALIELFAPEQESSQT